MAIRCFLLMVDLLISALFACSLYFLMGLRLQAGLHEWALHRPISGNVDPSTLSSLERDLLKDTLAVVKRFKAVLHQRLRLDLV